MLMVGEGVMKRFLVRYEGHVQGVGFRFNVLKQSAGLKLNGFVRNEPDGSVLMDVEGSVRDLKRLLARVETVMNHNIEATDVTEQPLAGKSEGLNIQY